MSIDSGDRNTYQKVKGKDYFRKAVIGAEKLAKLRGKTNSKVDLCFKFLVLQENQLSIFDTCKLAKEIGNNGKEYAKHNFLITRLLINYLDLMNELV